MFLYKFSNYNKIHQEIKVSFEFFPPKTESMENIFWKSLKRLSSLKPKFISVTYGASGSNRKRTIEIIERISRETNVDIAAHLTCVNATCDEVNQVACQLSNLGIQRFIALRGDPIDGINENHLQKLCSYKDASELVLGLKRLNKNFDISVSAYPEKHPKSLSFDSDIEFLKKKIDNGANQAITQAFFENDFYESYLEKVRKAGIKIPIIPGILPIHNFLQVKNFCIRNSTHIPEWLHRSFEGLENDPKTHALVSSALITEQVLDLLSRGIRDFHFYTLNHSDLTYSVCHLIGIRPLV